LTPENLDLIAGWASLVLTLLVFSYVLGDNVLYRLAIHVLVGVAAGYVAIVAVESVLWPWINDTILTVFEDSGDTATRFAMGAVGIVPFLIGVLLLFKASSRLAPIGNLGLAFIIGVGTAVAIVGAAAGTILPLAQDAGESVGDNTANGIVILVGTICTLVYFQYLAVRRAGKIEQPLPIRFLGSIGHGFIMIAFGALYAGAIVTSLTIFSDVVDTQLRFILERVGG
jgi:hypothetical protein